MMKAYLISVIPSIITLLTLPLHLNPLLNLPIYKPIPYPYLYSSTVF